MVKPTEHDRIDHFIVDDMDIYELIGIPEPLENKVLRVFTPFPFTLEETKHIDHMLVKGFPKGMENNLNGYMLILADNKNIPSPHWFCAACVHHYLEELWLHPENATDVELIRAILLKNDQYQEGTKGHNHGD